MRAFSPQLAADNLHIMPHKLVFVNRSRWYNATAHIRQNEEQEPSYGN
jgi:hypothetical protein